MAEKRITRKEIAERLEMSAYGWDLMLKRETMDISTLEKLSEILGVTTGYWFDADEDQKNLMHEDMAIYVLSKQLNVKDKQIEFLQELIKNTSQSSKQE